MELVALVKHDCPVCDQLLPALDRAGVRIVSQSDPADTAAQAERVGLSQVPELDDGLELSARLDPDAVPALVLLDGTDERDRVEGIQRDRLTEIAREAGIEIDVADLPEFRPGCASRTRDPDVAAGLAAREARRSGRIRARAVEVGALEDPFESLFDRGVTDGLPVVPPTPERVVAMLEHTSRDPQEVVAILPPYDGEATVEKVAINAVMAGCPGEALPVVLAAVEAAAEPQFALHGLLATTMPVGPTVVVSGPYAERIGMNSRGNAFGQGNRANVTIGRALQLVVRNVGGGKPGEEDRATHGQMGKVGQCFPERLEDSPWEPLSTSRGLAPEQTGVTLVAAEGPRVLVDQLARDPEGLCASLALALENVAHPKLRLAFDAMVVVGPEHGRIFREAGWSREQVQQRLFELTTSPASEIVRGAGGSPEGVDPKFVSDPDMPVAKFAAPDRILLAHAGGDAGLFSMIFCTWAAGEIGSAPVTKAVDEWL